MADNANIEVAALARHLQRPAMSLEGLQRLDAAQVLRLDELVQTAQDNHRKALDDALRLAIPWLVRLPVLHWLRR